MVAAVRYDEFPLFDEVQPDERVALFFQMNANDRPFDILGNMDGSIPAAFEVSEVTTAAASSDLKLNILLWMGAGLFSMTLLGFLTVYGMLNTSIENQRLEIKGDIQALSTKMDDQTKVVSEMRAEVGKLSGEIVKAKGEMIQEISKLGMRQAVLEETGKPLPKN